MVAMLFVCVAAGPLFIFGSVRYSREETNQNAQCRAAAQKNAQRTQENESPTQDSIATLKTTIKSTHSKTVEELSCYLCACMRYCCLAFGTRLSSRMADGSIPNGCKNWKLASCKKLRETQKPNFVLKTPKIEHNNWYTRMHGRWEGVFDSTTPRKTSRHSDEWPQT